MAKEDEDGVWRTIGGRRIFIRNGESLTDAMRKSGKFKKNLGKTTKKLKINKSEIIKNRRIENRMEKLEKAIEKARGIPYGRPDWQAVRSFQAEYDKLAKQLSKKKYHESSKMGVKANPQATEKEAFKKKYKESFDNWKKANPQATDDEIIGILKAKQYNGELSGNTENTIPNRFKDGFKVQNSKYSDESKMTLVEDGSGVRLIYDGKDTGTVLRNDLSDSEISSLRNAGKIQNMSEYLDQKDTLSRPRTKKDYDDRLNKISKIKEDGTYDLETGKLKNYTDGYQVTFSMTDMDFDDKAYQNLVEKFKAHDHGTVDAGKFEGYPEISFNVTDMKKALKLAYKYNQKSVWDWKNGTDISTGGTGEYKDYNPVTVDNLSKSVIRTRGLQNRILNYEDEIKNIRRKGNLSFTDKSRLMKLEREKEKLENQLK